MSASIVASVLTIAIMWLILCSRPEQVGRENPGGAGGYNFILYNVNTTVLAMIIIVITTISRGARKKDLMGGARKTTT